jgi:hypothetical protein
MTKSFEKDQATILGMYGGIWMLRQAYISFMAVEPVSKNPIVVLREVDGERTLPIRVGLLEAQTIADLLEGISFSSAVIHDLIGGIMDAIQVKVNGIAVSDPKDHSCGVIINILHKGRELAINAGPSDAFAFSYSAKAPIFVSEEVFDKSDQVDWQIEGSNDSAA